MIEIKKLACNFCSKNEFLFSLQLKWKLLKYEVKKFFIRYTKHVAKEKLQQRTNLENQLQKLERNLDEDNLSKIYNSTKNELDVIYNQITEGMRIWNKCDSYKHVKKLTNFFLNLKKQRGS